MVARGLAAPASGQVLSCWVDSGGQHLKLGELSVEDNVGYWWGWVSGGLPSVKAGDTFGVSIVSPDGSQSQPVMTGVLGS